MSDEFLKYFLFYFISFRFIFTNGVSFDIPRVFLKWAKTFWTVKLVKKPHLFFSSAGVPGVDLNVIITFCPF